MAGGNIHCGSFKAEDKSGSAFEAVIKDISAEIQEVVRAVDQQLTAQEYVLLTTAHTATLINPLEKYIDLLISQIGHDNHRLEIENEEKAGMDSVEGKWGLSRGWRLYCAQNLLSACRTSLLENEPVCIIFS